MLLLRGLPENDNPNLERKSRKRQTHLDVHIWVPMTGAKGAKNTDFWSFFFTPRGALSKFSQIIDRQPMTAVLSSHRLIWLVAAQAIW